MDASRRPATQLQRLGCAALQAATRFPGTGTASEWVTMASRLHLAHLGGEQKVNGKRDQTVRLIFDDFGYTIVYNIK